MTWIVEYALCDHCAQEVELLTDGREALVGGNPPEWIEADGAGWLTAPCPLSRVPGLPPMDEPCPGEVTFTGEGRGVEDPGVEGTVICRHPKPTYEDAYRGQPAVYHCEDCGAVWSAT